MTKHTSSKEKIEEAIRLLDNLQNDRDGFSTDWTGIRIAEIKKNLRKMTQPVWTLTDKEKIKRL